MKHCDKNQSGRDHMLYAMVQTYKQKKWSIGAEPLLGFNTVQSIVTECEQKKEPLLRLVRSVISSNHQLVNVKEHAVPTW